MRSRSKPSMRQSGASASKPIALGVHGKTGRGPGARQAAGRPGGAAQGARPRLPSIRESAAKRKARAQRILARLEVAYPTADCALRHENAYQLLVAVVLSAQCTDERVNQVTPALFARYPTVDALAAADPAELEESIRSTGFFRSKARNLLGLARRIVDEHAGDVPRTMEHLLELPGVARKTANCLLGTWYGLNEGMVVDTHVGRLAARLGLLSTARDDKDAVRIETDLMPLFPREKWTWLAHALIEHGRKICTARKPRCEACVLNTDCPSAFRVK